MNDWEQTGVDAGAEVEAAKDAAYAAFMAAAPDSAIGSPPATPSRTDWTTGPAAKELSPGDVVKLKKVVNAAIMDATLKHIGPVSGDNSITFGVVTVDGIKKLDMRGAFASWEHVTADPSSSPGLERNLFTIVWQDTTDNVPKPAALWVKSNIGNTNWSKIWPISVPSPTPLSDNDPLPDADEADPGNGSAASRWNHVHPLKRPEKIRYYLTDALSAGSDTEFAFAMANPHDEANAVDLVHVGGPAYWLVFVSPEGNPGIAVWPGGSIRAHLRVKLTNPQAGHTYKLYMGNRDIVYTSLVWDWTHSDTYQPASGPYPDQPTITEAYADLDFDIPVAAMNAGVDGRLGLNLRLRTYVGGSEASFSNEHIVVRVGGNNASYLDTLFTPSGGFSGVHNDLDGREAENCHPQDSITPGRIRWNWGGEVATVDGLLTMPAKSNSVRATGTEKLLGISTTGWAPGAVIFVQLAQARQVANTSPSPTGDYAVPSFSQAFGWGTPPTTLNAPNGATMVLVLSGTSNWVVLSAPWAGLSPGWVHTPFGATITLGTDGILSVPDPYQHSNSVKVSGSSLKGIDASYMPAGSIVQVRFSTNCRVYGGQTVTTPALPFIFPKAGGYTDADDLDIRTGPKGSATFQLDTDGWYLVGQPYVTDQT